MKSYTYYYNTIKILHFTLLRFVKKLKQNGSHHDG
jgi:hypothetical protein